MSQKLIIFDTTLRDGEQTPGVNLNLTEKLEIARQLERLGVDVIEAGFPATSPGDFEAVRAVSQSVKCATAALCRCVESDIRKGWDAVKYSPRPRLHIFIATSDIHMTHKLRMSADEVMRREVESVALAVSLCEDVEFSCEDASRSDPAFIHSILSAAIEHGARTVNIADTVGYAMPDEFGALVRGCIENVRGIDRAVMSVHCHNDLGLAVANTLASIANGARQIETTINGIGERAGNCSLEEIVMGLDVRASLLGISHAINTRHIHRTSQRVSALTGVPISPCKAILGANAFVHESGIHQDGMLKNPMTYEIMTPQSVGRTKSVLTLGKLSGRHAFAERLSDMGYSLSSNELETAFTEFKDLADRKKEISDGDLDAIVTHSISHVPDYYKLDLFQVQSSNKMSATASVSLICDDGRVETEAATGDGPIDAAYNAISRITGETWPLEDYAIRAVTGGVDALGEVVVRVRHGGELHIGRGLSTDVIDASILAYINAINRALAAQSKKD
jgi:2-isopropylmalate synthase